MKPLRTIIPLTMILAIGLGPIVAGDSSTFDSIATHYENIRQALLNDGTDGVAENATHIQHLVQTLESDLSDEAAGIRPGAADDLRALLPSIRESAVALAESGSIEDARTAFGKLSKTMVQYRQLTPEPLTVVAFCSMAQEVWLQPKGEIGNPYYGQSMARCGEIVSE